jgi:hypothetical protein
MQMEQSQGGELLVQHSHLTPDGGPFLHQGHLGPRLNQIQSSLDARDATADDQHAVAHATTPSRG